MLKQRSGGSVTARQQQRLWQERRRRAVLARQAKSAPPLPPRDRSGRPLAAGDPRSILDQPLQPRSRTSLPQHHAPHRHLAQSRASAPLPPRRPAVAPLSSLGLVSAPRPQPGKRPPQVPVRSALDKTAGSLGLLVYLTRLLVLGSGVAAIAGTILAIADPQTSAPRATSLNGAVLTRDGTVAPPIAIAPPALGIQQLTQQGRELTALKEQIQQWSAAQSELTPYLFFLNPETGEYITIGGDQKVSAASIIKVPVLIAFFQDVDAGKIKLDEPLTMSKDVVASEAGEMQYLPVGTQFSALETAEKMIIISDNTATNMLIKRLGGAEKLNERFRSWGLQNTVIHNLLPDLEGTNTVSPEDMAHIMLQLGDGKSMSASSRDRALGIMRQTVTNTLLPQGLDEGADIAHKTGDIGSVVGDVGLIKTSNGQRYVAAILVERPHNDPRAQELIRKISRLTYQTFSQTKADAAPAPTVTAPEQATPDQDQPLLRD